MKLLLLLFTAFLLVGCFFNADTSHNKSTIIYEELSWVLVAKKYSDSEYFITCTKKFIINNSETIQDSLFLFSEKGLVVYPIVSSSNKWSFWGYFQNKTVYTFLDENKNEITTDKNGFSCYIQENNQDSKIRIKGYVIEGAIPNKFETPIFFYFDINVELEKEYLILKKTINNPHCQKMKTSKK